MFPFTDTDKITEIPRIVLIGCIIYAQLFNYLKGGVFVDKTVVE